MMMMSPRLVCTLVVCVVIGAEVVMALPAPQFRFGMPAHFSFRTVHTPFQSGHPSQAPSTFFFRRPRLTAMAAKAAVNAQQTEQVQQPSVADTHVPVFVPVQNNFQGDSVIVSSDDLVNMGLTGTLENTAGTVDPAPAALEEGAPAEDLVPVADIQTDSLDAVNFEELPAGPLSIADDTFVLTASEAQPEPVVVDVVNPVDTIVIEPEVIPEVIQQVEPVAFQPVDPTTTVSPFQTETFNAYNQFLNTWLQLASVNLNRPELLKLVQPAVPTPQSLVQAEPEPQLLETQESVVQEPQPEVLEPVEVVQPVEQLPAVDETLPVATVTESVVSDLTAVDATTELPLAEAEVTTENFGLTAASVVEEATLVPETIHEVTFENFASEVVEPSAVVADTIPEMTSETVQSEVIVPSVVEDIVSDPAAAVVEQDIATNVIPSHFNTIPTYTSRGRLSGFRYSFSHVPQRGTFFFNSFTR